MRVLFIGHIYSYEINRKKLYFLDKKADFTLLTPHYWDDTLVRIYAQKDKNLNHEIGKVLFPGHEKIYIYLTGLKKLIKKLKPDIIHVEQGSDALSYTESILFANKYSPKTKNIFFTWMNKDYRIPFPITKTEKYNFKNSDFAICGNHDAVGLMKKRGFNGPSEIIPQVGVEPKLFFPKKSELKNKFAPQGEFLIGNFGRIVPEKGLDIALEALSRIKENWKFLIVGSGPDKENIEKLANKLKIREKVIIKPAVKHMELIDYINALDLYILPSVTTPYWKEQFGHVIIEAMSCGIPIIGSTCGEIPNVIGNAGLIVKERDIREWEKSIRHMMNNKRERTKYSRLGRQRVLENYTEEIIAKKTLDVYRTLLS